MTWDYNPAEYEKQAVADPCWRLERLIRYGIGREKIKREALEKYIHELNIPEDRRAFLELLLSDKEL
jgi:hypothetical protein